jgi:uncharacterized protein with ParB-like and HNH nuclease domain
VKAETVTSLNLFHKPVRYVVPLFQRPYVWEESKQWAPLWEDGERRPRSLCPHSGYLIEGRET